MKDFLNMRRELRIARAEIVRLRAETDRMSGVFTSTKERLERKFVLEQSDNEHLLLEIRVFLAQDPKKAGYAAARRRLKAASEL